MQTLRSAAELTAQTGRTFVISGANSGIGYEAALALAGAGAHVVMACRSADKAEAARARMLQAHPESAVDIVHLDLADLASVRACADEVRARFPRVDALINNAGVIGVRGQTTDGFEMQLGVNHLGHFALTGLLLGHLAASGVPTRVVTVSSIAHFWLDHMRWDDLMWENRRWSEWPIYGQSKLANLLFTFELARRLEEGDLPVLSVACHPGMSETNLVTAAPEAAGARFKATALRLGGKLTTQSAAKGALPTLCAATLADVRSGDYFGPRGPIEAWGIPKKVGSAARARDPEDMRRLWERSVELTGVGYEALTPVESPAAAR